MRRLLLLGVALIASAVLAACGAGTESAGAPASLSVRPCPPNLGANWRCAVVDVPLDRRGRVPGRVHLAVALRHEPGPPRPAVLALAGGPGAAALPAAHAFEARLAPLLQRRDLLIVDPRGTGASDPISCPGIDRSETWTPAQVATCARRLGPAAGHYGTRDTVRDLEDVRRLLGIPSFVVYGVSYGTKTAADYARTFPGRVSALVLDSPIVEDTDPFYRRSAAGAGRVLRNLCSQGACPRGDDPVRDLRNVVGRMRDGTITKAGETVTEASLLHAVVGGGPKLRLLPAALHRAAQGDIAALTGVLPSIIPDARDPGWLAPAFSKTVYLATSCDDGDFPWQRDQPPAAREQMAEEYLSRLPADDFGPFDKQVSLQYGEATMCASWPAARHHRFRRTLPDVPALLLVGGDDDLAPLEGAREIAAHLPRGHIVVVPEAGHGVLGTQGQAAGALASFARGLSA